MRGKPEEPAVRVAMLAAKAPVVPVVLVVLDVTASRGLTVFSRVKVVRRERVAATAVPAVRVASVG